MRWTLTPPPGVQDPAVRQLLQRPEFMQQVESESGSESGSEGKKANRVHAACLPPACLPPSQVVSRQVASFLRGHSFFSWQLERTTAAIGGTTSGALSGVGTTPGAQ